MQGIRKDQMKKLRGQQLKFIDKPFQSEHQIRSTRQRDSRRLKSKVKLPALGSNMYIITTSAKAIVRE